MDEAYLRIGEGIDVIIDVEIHGDEYHYVAVQRGSEQERIDTKSSFELVFLFIRTASLDLASRFAAMNVKPNQNFRRLMFEHQIELMRKIGPKWENNL